MTGVDRRSRCDTRERYVRVTCSREGLPVREVVTEALLVPGVPRVFVPCRAVCRQSCCRPRRVADGGGRGADARGPGGGPAVPAAPAAAGEDRTALTAAGAGKIRSGDLVVFCKPVAVAAAVVRRDGRVQAGGHPADHARLGIIEQQLDAMTGQPGTIGQVAGQVRPRGKVKGTARRSMTMAAALRAVLLMALMPEAGYGEILAALFGDLAAVPWHVPFAVPTDTVLATWRDAASPEPLLRLRDMVMAASAAEHEEHDYRALRIGDLHLGSIDGSVTRMPDTPGQPGRVRVCGNQR